MTYVSFWPEWRCEQAALRGEEGQPIEHIWGGWNQGTYYGTMAPGDQVIPITTLRGCIYLLGRITVDRVTDGDSFLADNTLSRSPDLCGNQVIIARDGSKLRFDVGLPPALLNDFTFQTVNGQERPLKGVQDGVVKRANQLHATVRVTSSTAERLNAVVDGKHLDTSQCPRLEGLERQLQQDPSDESACSVYIDALLEADDVRAQVATLERQVADGGSLQVAQQLWRMGNKHLPELIGRPGGYPFRSCWALRRIKPSKKTYASSGAAALQPGPA